MARMRLWHWGRFVDAAADFLGTWGKDLSLYSGGEGCYPAHDWGALSEVVWLDQKARCGLSE